MTYKYEMLPATTLRRELFKVFQFVKYLKPLFQQKPTWLTVAMKDWVAMVKLVIYGGGYLYALDLCGRNVSERV